MNIKFKDLLGDIDYDFQKEYENDPNIFFDAEIYFETLLEKEYDRGFEAGTGLYSQQEDDSK